LTAGATVSLARSRAALTGLDPLPLAPELAPRPRVRALEREAALPADARDAPPARFDAEPPRFDAAAVRFELEADPPLFEPVDLPLLERCDALDLTAWRALACEPPPLLADVPVPRDVARRGVEVAIYKTPPSARCLS
jgi:hypothetical protein